MTAEEKKLVDLKNQELKIQ